MEKGKMIVVLVGFCFCFTLLSCQSIETVKPKVEFAEQVDSQVVRIKWSLDYTSRYLEKYRIIYTVNDWHTSDDWPAQMKRSKILSTSNNQVYLLNKKKLECMNDCVKTVSCVGILNTPQGDGYTSNCALQQGIFVDMIDCEDNVDCANIMVYTNTATLEDLPYGYEYQFRVKVYDSYANKWSLDSDSSNRVDMRINIATNLTLQFTQKSTRNSAALLLTWKFDNIYEYYVSRYIIGLSINNSNFISTDSSQFFDKKKFSLVQYNVSYDVASSRANVDFEECSQSCYTNESCYYISYERTLRRCFYHEPKALRASKCPQNTICGFVKNDAQEYSIGNVKENTNYTVMIIYETYFGAFRVVYTSYKTPMFPSSMKEHNLDTETRDYIIIGACVGAFGILLIVATIVGLCVYHGRKKRAVMTAQNSTTNKTSSQTTFNRNSTLIRTPDDGTEFLEIQSENLVPTVELDDVYNAWNENDDRLLLDEYELIRNPSHLTFCDATRSENYNRNKYRDVYPYDFNRVKLKNLNINNENKSDYINASFIRNMNGDVKFISTQGPTKETVCDFWRMIVEYELKAIVMLMNFTEGHKLKCFHYWDDDDELDFSPYRVKCVSVKKSGFLIERLFHITFYKETFVVHHYHYVDWPDKGVPVSTHGVNALIDVIKAKHPFCDWPVLVHCNAGIGRSGTFIATDFLVEIIDKQNKMIYLPALVNSLRAQRAHMVQTFEQYKLIYKVILHRYFVLITKLDAACIESSFEELRLTKTENEGDTLLQHEFKSLDHDMVSEHVLVAEYPEKFNRRMFIPYDKALVRLPKLNNDVSTQYYDCTIHHDRVSNTVFLIAKNPTQAESYDFLRLLDAYRPHLVLTMDDVPLYPSGKHECITRNEFKLTANELIKRKQAVYYIESEPQTVTFKNQKLGQTHNFLRFNLTKDFNASDANVKTERFLCSIDKILRSYINLKKTMQIKNPIVLLQSDDAGDRCAFMCAIVMLTIKYLKTNEIDVFQTIRKLRHSRSHMISTWPSYEFLYEIIVQFIINNQMHESAREQYDISVLV